MKAEPKSTEQVSIEENKGVKAAHTGAMPSTKVEQASKGAEQERMKSEEKKSK